MIRRRTDTLWRPQDEASAPLAFLTICAVLGMLALYAGLVLP
jgi:hypothetical protein